MSPKTELMLQFCMIFFIGALVIPRLYELVKLYFEFADRKHRKMVNELHLKQMDKRLGRVQRRKKPKEELGDG